MAAVIDIAFGEFQGKPGSGDQVRVMNTYCGVMLIDAVEDDGDEWTMSQISPNQATLGDGRGIWVRKASTKTIDFRNSDGATSVATMIYLSWPLRYMDYGKIKLTKPLRGGSSEGSKSLELDFMVGRIR